MIMNLIKHNYLGNTITFKLNDGIIMVNLTEMSKPYRKLPADFLRLHQTKLFIEVLRQKYVMGIPITMVRQGGNNQGTWGHQKLALKFAGWLNPEFELWVYDKIEELLTQGYTKLESISRKDLAQMLLDAEIEKEKALQHVEACNTQLRIQQPKVQFYDQVVKSNGLLELNQAAKLLGIGRNKMCQKLREINVFFKGTQPYQDYISRGYFKLKEQSYLTDEGIGIATQTFVTQKGLAFLNRKFNYTNGNEHPKSSLSELTELTELKKHV